jgi:hypothetical protein
MPKRKTINGPNGEPIEVEQIPFRSGQENWNEYLLEDGTVIRLKTVVTDVQRGVGLYDPEGNPMYFVKTANIVNVDAPEKLRKGIEDASGTD